MVLLGCILLDAQVQAWKRDFDWSINQIILDIKPLTSLFCSVEFDYIPRALNGART